MLVEPIGQELAVVCLLEEHRKDTGLHALHMDFQTDWHSEERHPSFVVVVVALTALAVAASSPSGHLRMVGIVRKP